MEKTQLLFKTKTKVDNKSIVNRLNKPVSNEILKKIESGVTLEDIDEMVKQGLPILKYHTQITIHGLFDDLTNNYIFGYKNVFQNKNRSIGVKYNAIDEEKRQRIDKRLGVLGFRYSRNSSSVTFSITEPVNEDNYTDVYNRLISIKNKIDLTLFYGGVYMYAGNLFGQKYLVLELVINAIYEKNIEPFLNKLGATKESVIESQKEHDAYWAEQKRKWEKEKADSDAKRKRQIDVHSEEIDWLKNNLKRVEKTNDLGVYIQRTFDYNDNLVFRVTMLYKNGRQKFPRINKTEFSTLKGALRHNPKKSYSDSVFKGKLTGFKINNK
jgi:hypothetical protein